MEPSSPQDLPEFRPEFAVACPAQRRLLNILRRFVSSVAEAMGFTEDDVAKIEMAVDEACSNAFLHAYDEETPASEAAAIQLKLQLGDDNLTIKIEDRGKGFAKKGPEDEHSIQSYAQPGRDSYHGLGILIMKEFMDDVHFDGGINQGTQVTLRKFLRPREPLNGADQTEKP